MTLLFPIIYSAALTYLVWKAFKVMSKGWGFTENKQKKFYSGNLIQKKYTIHPELLDYRRKRFSNDNDTDLIN